MAAYGSGQFQRQTRPQAPYGAAPAETDTPLAQPAAAGARPPAAQAGAAPSNPPTSAPITSNAIGRIPGAGNTVTGSAQKMTAATPWGSTAQRAANAPTPSWDLNAHLSDDQRAQGVLAGAPGVTPPPPEDPPPTQMDDWQQQWSDIYADYEKSLPEQFRQADLAAASQGRRQNELNAIMGGTGGIGGMYGSTMAQMGLTGQNLRMQAQAEHDKRGLEMKLGWLDQQIKLAEAQNNRDLAAQLQAEQNKTQLAIAQAEAGMTPSTGGGVNPFIARLSELLEESASSAEGSSNSDPAIGQYPWMPQITAADAQAASDDYKNRRG